MGGKNRYDIPKHTQLWQFAFSAAVVVMEGDASSFFGHIDINLLGCVFFDRLTQMGGFGYSLAVRVDAEPWVGPQCSSESH